MQNLLDLVRDETQLDKEALEISGENTSFSEEQSQDQAQENITKTESGENEAGMKETEFEASQIHKSEMEQFSQPPEEQIHQLRQFSEVKVQNGLSQNSECNQYSDHLDQNFRAYIAQISNIPFGSFISPAVEASARSMLHWKRTNDLNNVKSNRNSILQRNQERDYVLAKDYQIKKKISKPKTKKIYITELTRSNCGLTEFLEERLFESHRISPSSENSQEIEPISTKQQKHGKSKKVISPLKKNILTESSNKQEQNDSQDSSENHNRESNRHEQDDQEDQNSADILESQKYVELDANDPITSLEDLSGKEKSMSLEGQQQIRELKSLIVEEEEIQIKEEEEEQEDEESDEQLRQYVFPFPPQLRQIVVLPFPFWDPLNQSQNDLEITSQRISSDDCYLFYQNCQQEFYPSDDSTYHFPYNSSAQIRNSIAESCQQNWRVFMEGRHILTDVNYQEQPSISKQSCYPLEPVKSRNLEQSNSIAKIGRYLLEFLTNSRNMDLIKDISGGRISEKEYELFVDYCNQFNIRDFNDLERLWEQYIEDDQYHKIIRILSKIYLEKQCHCQVLGTSKTQKVDVDLKTRRTMLLILKRMLIN